MDVEAGMAKMVASEYANEVVEDAFRIHGGYGYSKEYEIERLMREVKFMLIGEGTSDIQKMIIGRCCSRTTSCADPIRAGQRPPVASAAASAAASASLAASTASGERTCSIASAEAPSTAASPPAREVTMRRCSVASGSDRW